MTALATAPGAAPETGSRRDRRDRWLRRAPLLPALVFTVVLTQVPFVTTLVLSSLNWNPLRPGERGFAGLANYVTVFTDSRLRSAVLNTVVLTASIVGLSLVLGLALAVLLDRRFPGRSVARTLLIAPFLVMPVAAALLWKHAIYNPTYGLLNGSMNALWRLFGAEQGPVVDWIGTMPKTAVVVALVWQWTPFMMLILLAGLQAQSLEVLEAARVDGAGGRQTFTSLTLPHLRQYLELAGLLGTIYIIQTFDHIFTITAGGPGTATTNLPYEIYLTMFSKYEYGEASAAGVVAVAGSIAVAVFALRVVSTLFRQEASR